MAQDLIPASSADKIGQSESKPKRKKIITVVIFFVIIAAIVYLGWVEGSRWWKEKQEWVRMGFAEDKFPFRMYTEKELVERGLWSGESPALNAVPTRTRPEETYTIFRQALTDGDLNKAAECFIDDQQEAWKKSLQEIKENGLLQEMLNDLPDKLEDTYVYTDDITGKDTKNRDLNSTAISLYEYYVERNGKNYSHTISFVKDWEGDWKLEDL